MSENLIFQKPFLFLCEVSKPIENIKVKSNTNLILNNNKEFEFDLISIDITEIIINILMNNFKNFLNSKIILFGNQKKHGELCVNFIKILFENNNNVIIKINGKKFFNFDDFINDEIDVKENLNVDVLQNENEILCQFSFIKYGNDINNNNNEIEDFNNEKNTKKIYVIYLNSNDNNEDDNNNNNNDVNNFENDDEKNLNIIESIKNRKLISIKTLSHINDNETNNLNNNNNNDIYNENNNNNNFEINNNNNNNNKSYNFDLNNNNNNINKSFQTAPLSPTKNELLFLNDKINTLDQTINNINNQNKNISNILSKLLQNNNINNNNNILNQTSSSDPNKNVPFLEHQISNLKTQQNSLITDNIIFREDIIRLNDINAHLEQEIHNQIIKNKELAQCNEKINNENCYLNSLIENTYLKINNNVSNNNINIDVIRNIENEINVSNEKINKIKNDYKNLREKKAEIEINLNLLNDKYEKLIKKFACNKNKLNDLNCVQKEKINEIENNINVIINNTNEIKKSNNDFIEKNENLRKNIFNNENEKNNYEINYNEIKNKNNLLEKELNEIKEEFSKFKEDVRIRNLKKIEEEERKKNIIENKKKMISELERKINNFRNDRIRKLSDEI